jgi:hypothetical protein
VKTNRLDGLSDNPFSPEALSGSPGSGVEAGECPAEEALDASDDGEGEASLKRLAKGACLAFVSFLVVVLFVFREIHHTQKVYQMGLQISAAEEEKHQWQEKHRLEAARAAGLVAALHGQQCLEQNFETIKTVYGLPGVRR